MLAIALGWMILVMQGLLEPCGATVIRVPLDVPTIQAGLDSSANGDTIAVAVGIYAEALLAPPHSFVLRGEVIPDTGEYPRPIVDPAPLPGSDTLACLVLPSGSQAVIEDFKFRNGPEMFPHPTGYTGGIRSQANALALRRCLIDTVFNGVSQVFGFGDTLTLEECKFRGDSSWCVYAPLNCQISNCYFSGAGSYLVHVSAHSRISNCQFEHNGTGGGYLLQPTGTDIEVRDCLFGPDNDSQHGWMIFLSRTSAKIMNNAFVDSEVWCALDVYLRAGDTVDVGRNSFINLAPGGFQTGTPIRVSEQGGEPEGGVVSIQENIFSHCTSSNAPTAVHVIRPAARLEGNRFFHLSPVTLPAVEQYTGWDPGDSVILKDNLLVDVGIAARGDWNMDARWNWWGDATGPYHATRNPAGLGEEVQGDLIFLPWHSDTSFVSTPHPYAPLPVGVSFVVFPNPFNATATLKLYVTQPGIFQMDLYNTLGQHVKQLWSGAVAYEKQVTLDGGALASGIYFVRVWQPIENRPVALQKVIIAK